MKYILSTIVLLFIIACSPRYEIKTHYTLPIDVMGRQCVQTCSNERKICQNHCNKKQEQCLATAEQSARDTFPALIDEYRNIEDQYNHAMYQYNMEMDRWEHHKERLRQDLQHYHHKCKNQNSKSYECQQAQEIDDELHHMYQLEPEEPVPPIEPSLSTEIKNSQKVCHNQCGCTKDYDNCFISCGGKLEYEKFCVENCN